MAGFPKDIDLSEVTLLDGDKKMAMGAVEMNGNGVLLVPYTKQDRRYIIQMAPKSSPSSKELLGREIKDVSGSYVIKVVRTESTMASKNPCQTTPCPRERN